MINKRFKVAVAMSGGVDSSVAALLLKQQGYQVIGLTMSLLPCGQEKKDGCCGLEAVESARKVAHQLNISHYVLNFRRQFQKNIIQPFCQEYLNGRTPNPCVECNRFIKFNLLLRRAKELGADFLATGHYARLRREIRNPKFRKGTWSPRDFTSETLNKSKISAKGGSTLGGQNLKFKTKNFLLKGRDKEKDQSYFLYCLTQEQLRYLIFPLGDLTKKQVRGIAQKNNLATAKRIESQEICFVPNNDYRKFIARTCVDRTRTDADKTRAHIEKTIRPGVILDKGGKILGEHQGIGFYTIGQRKGLGISSCKPLYVIKIDSRKDLIIVGSEKDLYQKKCFIKNVNWISGQPPKIPIKVMVKIRYKRQAASVILHRGLKSKIYSLQFSHPQRAVTPGQSAVFYQRNLVLGGGIIV